MVDQLKARRRYSAAPGLRGFVPHKTPWAP
jgi:hypothetical protein